MENNIYDMNPVEFNNFIKQLRQQYKQHIAGQKEQEKAQKKQKAVEQKKQTGDQKTDKKKVDDFEKEVR